jgi:hypothetical protein
MGKKLTSEAEMMNSWWMGFFYFPAGAVDQFTGHQKEAAFLVLKGSCRPAKNHQIRILNVNFLISVMRRTV